MNKILVLFFALVSSSVFATTWYVAKSGKDTNMGKSEGTAFLTIQKAVDSASDGDLILVGSGVYSPTSISKNGVVNSNKKIIIKSLNGYKDTIIDAQNKMCCLYDGGNYNYINCTLIGFSLINGRAPSNFNMGGGAIGGRLVNCVISNCYALANAGGAHFTRMENCLILACNAPEGYASAAYSCELRNCTVTQNRLEGSLAGGQCALYECAVYNTIVYDNPSGGLGPGCSAHNCVTSDPKFRDAAHGDYRLQKSSPCIDAGDNSYSTTDTDLAGKVRIYNGKVDIGAYEYQPDVLFGGIRNIVAKQRYPWNGLVDLHFTITGDAGTKYDTSFTAKDMVGNTNIAMRTIRKADGTAAAAKEQLMPDTYNWVWDAAVDLPKDFKCDRVTVTGTVNEFKPLYMVIDLSSGANSSKYPVSYLDDVPSGGWSDTYKTTKLVLRRIEAGTFTMGSPSGENGRSSNETQHSVTLTKAYYLGVFELTAKQYQLVMGSLTYRPYPDQSGYAWIGFNHGTGKTGWEKYPMEDLKFYKIRGKTNGLSTTITASVDSDSLIGLLRSRTGVTTIDLPTEAQWEYACRAGSTKALYTNVDIPHSDFATDSTLTGIAVYYTTAGTSPVGTKKPNNWGLYDMYGNVWEWCLDWYTASLTSTTDPLISNSSGNKVCRGGSYGSPKISCRSACRMSVGKDAYRAPAESINRGTAGSLGMRLCVTLSE